MFPTMEVQLTREYLMAQRQALLLQIEAIELLLNIKPRTSEIRKAAKELAPVVQFEKEKEGVNDRN